MEKVLWRKTMNIDKALELLKKTGRTSEIPFKKYDSIISKDFNTTMQTKNALTGACGACGACGVCGAGR